MGNYSEVSFVFDKNLSGVYLSGNNYMGYTKYLFRYYKNKTSGIKNVFRDTRTMAMKVTSLCKWFRHKSGHAQNQNYQTCASVLKSGSDLISDNDLTVFSCDELL